MAEPPPNADTGAGRERESTNGTPRWVKVFGIIALVVVLLFVILMFAGGGRHGPGRHMRRADNGGQTRPQSGH
jgi:hypothetical protein